MLAFVFRANFPSILARATRGGSFRGALFSPCFFGFSFLSVCTSSASTFLWCPPKGHRLELRKCFNQLFCRCAALCTGGDFLLRYWVLVESFSFITGVRCVCVCVFAMFPCCVLLFVVLGRDGRWRKLAFVLIPLRRGVDYFNWRCSEVLLDFWFYTATSG